MTEEPLEPTDTDFAMGRLPGKFYISKPFGFEAIHIPGETSNVGTVSRFAYTVIVPDHDLRSDRENGLEVIIRETPTGRFQLKAVFTEDDRGIKQLSIQRYNAKSGVATKTQQVILTGQDIDIFAEFLASIATVPLPEARGYRFDSKVIRDAVAEALANPEAPRRVYEANRDDVYHLIESDQDARDVVALARRRGGLGTFKIMLGDPGYVRAKAIELGVNGTEAVWQRFFDDNRWIFGFGLAEQVLVAWRPERLEAVVRGASIAGPGKRADAVMRSMGTFSAFSYVEIKTPETALLGPEYRAGAYPISTEVAGAIAQCHRTLESAEARLLGRLNVKDIKGFDTGEVVYSCRPRSYLVVGNLKEFVSDTGGIHPDRFRSFEQLRRGLSDPAIITYDELYERAARIVEGDL